MQINETDIMSFLNWFANFDWSAIAGVIGATTGIISLIKVSRLKSLDLRMERGKVINTIQVKLDGLNDLCQKADQSRIYRFAAQGLSQSGSMEKWKQELEKHKKTIKDLSDEFAAIKGEKISGNKLEDNILKLHGIEERIKSLLDDLKASIAEDDAARDRLFRMKFENQNRAAG